MKHYETFSSYIGLLFAFHMFFISVFNLALVASDMRIIRDENVLKISNITEYVAIGNRLKLTCTSYNKRFTQFGILFGSSRTILMDTMSNGTYQLSDVGNRYPQFPIINKIIPPAINKSIANQSFTLFTKPLTRLHSAFIYCEGSGHSTSERIKDYFYENGREIFVGNPPNHVTLKTLVNDVNTVELKRDDRVTIKCSSKIEISNPRMHLYFNDEYISDATFLFMGFENFQLVRTISIRNPPQFDGMIVKCVAENNFGRKESKINLIVKYSPTEELIYANGRSESSLSVNVSEEIVCSSSGNPVPESYWVSPNISVFNFNASIPNIIVAKAINGGPMSFPVVCKAGNIEKTFNITILGSRAKEISKSKDRILLLTIYLLSILIILVFATSLLLITRTCIYKNKRLQRRGTTTAQLESSIECQDTLLLQETESNVQRQNKILFQEENQQIDEDVQDLDENDDVHLSLLIPEDSPIDDISIMAGVKFPFPIAKYPTNQRKPLAKGIIFVNHSFDDTVSFPTRHEAEIDKNTILNSLQPRGIVIDQFSDVHQDKTISEITQIIEELTSNSTEHYSAFVFVMSSYGCRDRIYGKDGNALNINTDILLPFGRCEKLKKKPKIFLLQGCQSPPTNNSSPAAFTQAQLPSHSDFEDICLALPQPPGFMAQRSTYEGSALVAMFTEVLNKYGDTRDITQVLVKMSKRALPLSISHSHNNVPWFQSTLDKLFFFKNTETIVIDNFEIYTKDELGRGGFSIVYRGKHGDTEENVAVKKYAVQLTDEMRQFAVEKAEVMKEFQSDYLVQLLHFNATFDKDFWIFLELCDLGDLNDFFISCNPEQSEIVSLMVHVASGVKFLHENEVIHKNIKPEKIFVKSNEKDGFVIAKIADIGFATTTEDSSSTTVIGSASYMAPEMLYSQDKHEKSVDIFSTGLLFFAMISFKRGRKTLIPSDDDVKPVATLGQSMHLLSTNNEQQRAANIHKKIVAVKGDKIEKEIRKLILKMISFEGKCRLPAQSVLEVLQNISSRYSSSLMVTKDLQNTKSLNLPVAVFNTTEVNFAAQTDSQKLTRAANVIYGSWKKNKLRIKLWNLLLVGYKGQVWDECNLSVNHSVELEQFPEYVQILTLLDNILLLRANLDYETSQFISVDSSNGEVLHKSLVYTCDGVPGYCCNQSQVLIPDWRSSSITQLDALELNNLNTWADERVRLPMRVSSNKNRAAMFDDCHKTISVFKWEDVHLSHDMIYTVDFVKCVGVQVLPDGTLMAFSEQREWSVWNESGTPVYTTVQHPTLVADMEVSWHVLQDPVTGQWFVQEHGRLQDLSHCAVIYDLRIVADRLSNGDRSTIENNTNLNKILTHKYK